MQASPTLGTRLRDARLALGLTQAQAADGIVSSSFLSLIESGQRTPSPQVAAALAGRLRLPLDDLTDATPTGAVAVEVALRLGQWQAAAGALEQLPAGTAEHAFYAGLVAEQRGDFATALAHLDAASTAATCPAPLRLRALGALCRVARSAGDLYRSIEVGERALIAIATDPGADPDVEAEVRATLAGTYCETGDLLRARELTDASRLRRHDPWSLASQRWARSMVMQTAGQFAEARALALEALELLRTLDRPRSEARLRNTAAWIAMQEGNADLDQVAIMLGQAEGAFRDNHADTDLALTLSSRAELELRRGDRQRAHATMCEALALLEGRESGLRARVVALAAQVFAAAGDAMAAQAHLLEARLLLEESGAHRSAAATWRQMAETYEDLGQPDLAVACLKAATDLLGLQPLLSASSRLTIPLAVVDPPSGQRESSP